MYTPIQLEAIKLFGKKDLTEGCLVFQPEYDYTFKIPEDEWDLMVAMRNWFRWTTILEISESKVWFEILWHIPELFPDVYVAMKNKWDDIINFDKYPEWWRLYFRFWHIIPYNPTLSLLDQPSLPQIISLFK